MPWSLQSRPHICNTPKLQLQKTPMLQLQKNPTNTDGKIQPQPSKSSAVRTWAPVANSSLESSKTSSKSGHISPPSSIRLQSSAARVAPAQPPSSFQPHSSLALPTAF
ncbi:hypothetical protein Pyn_29381 [Prunus yedoensis var. nudiflora]|uniref:Uncharacterized protein n=1 Tax=Prunus yedoensis var. nudiflora TaxID=2094558 RepID=A0A314YHG5_PRUYE|nr:hypothetical protein Pyn_29381 [Prunus yedoensis var. nudiflora]